MKTLVDDGGDDLQPEPSRRLFGQPWTVWREWFNRASVNSNEHNRWCGGEDLRCKQGRNKNTRPRNCMQLFSSFLLQREVCISKSPRGGWLYCNPWKKLQRFSLLLLGLIFTTLVAVTTTAHQAHYYYPHDVHSKIIWSRRMCQS